MEYQIYESYDTFLLYQEFMEIPGNTFLLSVAKRDDPDNRNDAHLYRLVI